MTIDSNTLYGASAVTVDSVRKDVTKAELVDQYADSLYRFCRRITYSKEDADDLFQDSYAAAFAQMPKVAAAESPIGFLLSTAAYLNKSWRRKFARRNRIAPMVELFAATDDTPLAASIEDAYLASEEKRVVRELTKALPDKYKIPVVLYYTLEMGIGEIAKILKIPVGTVKSRLHKARQIIKKGMKTEYGY
ncbi:MAG: RNA polymerase sigma factor [Gracilibacteraceae bacterium]|jgi:RNA polymerase sigma-70 factor (ECF subfamily)|nr:RNA polymerase sigma factor [Gracilibacteraceae bacterium]